MPDLNMIYQDMRKTDEQLAETYELALKHDRQIEELQESVTDLTGVVKSIVDLLAGKVVK